VKKKAVCFGHVMLYAVYAVTKEKVQIYIRDISHSAGDQVQNCDMDRACDADRGEERYIQGFDGET
jgi:hypothetical protein